MSHSHSLNLGNDSKDSTVYSYVIARKQKAVVNPSARGVKDTNCGRVISTV